LQVAFAAPLGDRIRERPDLQSLDAQFEQVAPDLVRTVRTYDTRAGYGPRLVRKSAPLRPLRASNHGNRTSQTDDLGRNQDSLPPAGGADKSLSWVQDRITRKTRPVKLAGRLGRRQPPPAIASTGNQSG